MRDFDAVGEFHRKFGLPFAWQGSVPALPAEEVMAFRLGFLAEELRELTEANAAGDLEGVADALVDLVYVALGTAHLCGLPWTALFNAVQAANMAKERCGIDHRFMGCQGKDTPQCKDGCVIPDRCHWYGTCDEGGAPVGEYTCARPAVRHSKRGSQYDVIKPEGWRPPDLGAILRDRGWRPASPAKTPLDHEFVECFHGVGLCTGDPVGCHKVLDANRRCDVSRELHAVLARPDLPQVLAEAIDRPLVSLGCLVCNETGKVKDQPCPRCMKGVARG